MTSLILAAVIAAMIHAPAGHLGVGIAQDPTSAGIPHPSAGGDAPGQGGG